MKLFLDTADVAQIREVASWGILDGVTTNPTHVSKTGRKPLEVYKEILDLVDGPISLGRRNVPAPVSATRPRNTNTQPNRAVVLSRLEPH